MTMNFRVVDARGPEVRGEQMIVASSPEDAARQMFGFDLVRGGRRVDLIARVYWTRRGEPTSMVRLYSQANLRA